mmetsp:Transcript_5795/g.11487  ORF Transcript_5795/g.11487 Transcript_5795/m.11487 type:complete len:249 (-) Transcript_5795:211-957(-)
MLCITKKHTLLAASGSNVSRASFLWAFNLHLVFSSWVVLQQALIANGASLRMLRQPWINAGSMEPMTTRKGLKLFTLYEILHADDTSRIKNHCVLLALFFHWTVRDGWGCIHGGHSMLPRYIAHHQLSAEIHADDSHPYKDEHKWGDEMKHWLFHRYVPFPIQERLDSVVLHLLYDKFIIFSRYPHNRNLNIRCILFEVIESNHFPFDAGGRIVANYQSFCSCFGCQPRLLEKAAVASCCKCNVVFEV